MMQVAEAEEELRVCRAELQKAEARLRAISQEFTGVQKEVLASSTDLQTPMCLQSVLISVGDCGAHIPGLF